jgi:hypothetical protein
MDGHSNFELLLVRCATSRGVESTLSLAPSSRKFSNVGKEFVVGVGAIPKLKGLTLVVEVCHVRSDFCVTLL